MSAFHLGLSLILGLAAPLLAKQWRFPEDCGFTKSNSPSTPGSRHHADPGKFPWAVHVKVFTEGRFHKECQGSIITRRHVLTSAYCITTNRRINAIRVRYGDIDLRRTKEVSATGHTFHHLYDPNTPHYDVAILLLEHALEFTDQVQPVCLPRRRHFIEGEKLFLTTWGRQEGVKQGDNFLQYFLLRILPRSNCKEIYGGKYQEFITFCALEIGRGMGTGYWGGSSTIVTDDGRHMQMGIASQYTEDQQARSSVFTRVDALISWIQQHIENDNGYTRISSGSPQPLGVVPVPSYLFSAGPLPAQPVAPDNPFVPTTPFAALYR